MNAIPWLQAAAQAYNRTHALPPIVEGHNAPVNVEQAQAIAQAYDKLPSYDAGAELAYGALVHELRQQYKLCTETLGITFEPWLQASEPYANSRAMQADVRDNKHLYYFIGGEEHPYLGLLANDMFRCVHDVFGHAAEGYQFGPRGEHNAWLHHSQMFSPLAQRALTTETRGQNSWVNYGPHAGLPACERPFAEQKAALLPVEYCAWQAALKEGK